MINSATGMFSKSSGTPTYCDIFSGLPARPVVNKIFLALALASGLDSAILDPLDRDLMETLLTTVLVLGKDKYCISYTRAFREGKIGQVKTVKI
ncbi:MAG: hypothetical protein HF978_08955 [Desulfobacteraceae bacterium]|nr:hypothetical protein [Desulfobacteraceae bacterium]MBC2755662.1 hypothetical protein [Desulfobacteraceae bacterium]